MENQQSNHNASIISDIAVELTQTKVELYDAKATIKDKDTLISELQEQIHSLNNQDESDEPVEQETEA